MTDALIVFCTCSSREEAAKLADLVVTEGAAACVNVLPAIESVYRWEGKVEKAQEVLLLIKTTRERFAAVQEIIARTHSYDTPEVIAVPVVAGSPTYLAWLGAQIAT